MALMTAQASASGLATGGAREKTQAPDMFLKFDPEIKSGAGQGDHKDWIEVLSFSWGESIEGGGQAGGALRAGGVSATDFQFATRTITKASPTLFLSCANGDHFKSIQLNRIRGGGAGILETTIKLEDVLISSYSLGGSVGNDVGENVTLNFSKLSFKFQPFDSRTGKIAGGPVETKFDLQAQKKA